MSVDSFAKIDMSLDDIIKLNKKEKKKAILAEQKKKTPNKKLTAAQRKRAETLKKNAKLNKLKRGQQVQNQGGNTVTRRGPRLKTNPATKAANVRRKNKAGMTKGGKINIAKQRQINAASNFGPKNRQRNRLNRQSGLQQMSRPIISPKTAARPSVQDRLGVRIDRTKNNQRHRRQQFMNKNRQGLVSRPSNQNTGLNSSRGRGRSNRGRRNNAQQARNRQYNQQPRDNARQLTRRGGSANKRRQNNQQRNASRFFSNQLNTTRRGRGRGAAKNQRKVTLV